MHNSAYPFGGYEWDEEKAVASLGKHGVDFADAVAGLEDPLSISIADPDSRGEERFIALGRDAVGQVLVIAYTWRDERVRVISARRANRWERRRYEEER